MLIDRDTGLAYDRHSLRSKDRDGRLHVELCNISKANVCPYWGREIPGYEQLGLDPNRVYRMYRHPDELRRAADTFRNLPLLNRHVAHTAATYDENSVCGTIGTTVRFEHPYLKSPIAVWTQDAIASVEDESKSELSSSYRYTPDMTPGVSWDGVAYDGVMRDIVGNHVALVQIGRAGPDVAVADSLPQGSKMKHFISKLVALLAPQAPAEQVVALDEALAQDLAALQPAKEPAVIEPPAPVADEAKQFTQADIDAAVAAARAADAQAATQAAEAARLAADQATAANEARETAKAAVAPVVGDVTCDSADAYYTMALGKLGVDITGVHASALPALFAVSAKAAQAAAATAPVVIKPTVAVDSATVFGHPNIRKGL